jgi:hypothetical protein
MLNINLKEIIEDSWNKKQNFLLNNASEDDDLFSVPINKF